jgi:hypothetical protein
MRRYAKESGKQENKLDFNDPDIIDALTYLYIHFPEPTVSSLEKAYEDAGYNVIVQNSSRISGCREDFPVVVLFLETTQLGDGLSKTTVVGEKRFYD